MMVTIAPLLVRAHAALAALLVSFAACSKPEQPQDPGGSGDGSPSPAFEIRAGKPVEALPGETHFRNVRQLTFGGENAEAYWSFDGTKLIFQSTRPPEIPADQIFTIDLATGEEKMVSTGKGRTTCAYFLKGDQEIVFASTHLAADEPPPAVRVIEGKYVWPIFETYEVFRANVDGSNLRRLTDFDGYDAEATVDPVTGRIVFTSMRDGELDVYTMDPDGADVRRVTQRMGYDGGAFYSHDGKKLVLRSGFPADEAAAADYQKLLAQGYVMPSKMEITVCDADGSNFRQVTNNGKANFAPYWLPDNERILFSSSMGDESGRNFDIYMIREDGTGLEQITHCEEFDGFPMFSPDGKYIAFASNRFGAQRGDTNIFVAEWVENP